MDHPIFYPTSLSTVFLASLVSLTHPSDPLPDVPDGFGTRACITTPPISLSSTTLPLTNPGYPERDPRTPVWRLPQTGNQTSLQHSSGMRLR